MSRIWLIGAICTLATSACNKKQSDGEPVHSPAAVDDAGKAEDGEASVAPKAANKIIEQPPAPELHPEPVERRLYTDRIEASSFLWTDWNRFQENYHPNYIIDGDDRTAWVEGADSDGVGEWIRLHLSPIQGATGVRLRIHNGYHKSKGLYRKNARIRGLEIVTLPGGHRHQAELPDTMDWHEIAFDQPPATVEAIELHVVSVYPGTKYTDLCVSDLELYVTGRNVENPAFEKAKLDEILTWKRNRLAAAELLGGASASKLPIKPAYRVAFAKAIDRPEPPEGANGYLRALLAALADEVGPGLTPYAARAERALASDFADWLPVQVTSKQPLVLPDVDGLANTPDWVLAMGEPERTFYLPSYGDNRSLLLSSRLTLFDQKGDDPRTRDQCKAGEAHFMRPPRDDSQGPNPRQLLLVRCAIEETREGEATYLVWQLLDYDPKGQLKLVTGPTSVTWLDWDESSDGAVVKGGMRLAFGRQLQTLADAQVVAAD